MGRENVGGGERQRRYISYRDGGSGARGRGEGVRTDVDRLHVFDHDHVLVGALPELARASLAPMYMSQALSGTESKTCGGTETETERCGTETKNTTR